MLCFEAGRGLRRPKSRAGKMLWQRPLRLEEKDRFVDNDYSVWRSVPLGVGGRSPIDIHRREGQQMTSVNLEKLTKAAKDRGRRFRVLIVDDEPWIRDVFTDFCAVSDAFEVDIAENGAEAISKIEASEYDLITLDLIMPEVSGLDALSEIKRTSPQVPVMVITGNATEKLVHEAGILGASKVMYKPIRLENFIEELTSALLR